MICTFKGGHSGHYFHKTVKAVKKKKKNAENLCDVVLEKISLPWGLIWQVTPSDLILSEFSFIR